MWWTVETGPPNTLSTDPDDVPLTPGSLLWHPNFVNSCKCWELDSKRKHLIPRCPWKVALDAVCCYKLFLPCKYWLEQTPCNNTTIFYLMNHINWTNLNKYLKRTHKLTNINNVMIVLWGREELSFLSAASCSPSSPLLLFLLGPGWLSSSSSSSSSSSWSLGPGVSSGMEAVTLH